MQRSEMDSAVRLASMIHFDEILLALYSYRHHVIEQRSEERVAAFYRSLGERVHERWSVDRAAAETRLSRRRFTELFRRVAGEPFSLHLQRLRLETACELLIEEEQSIAGAAFSCGFEDLSHFYRSFRRHFGVPPGQWVQRQNSEPRRRQE